MNSSKIVLTICIVLAGVIGLLLGSSLSHPAPAESASSSATFSAETPALPAQIFYGQVFSLLVALKNSDDYQRQAALTDEQAAALMKIANDCQRQVLEQDAKAQVAMKALRDKLPKSETIRQPLPQLVELQQARDEIILRHRDQLRAAIGDDAFNRITEAAKNIVHITIRPMQAEDLKSPEEPR
jgi:hypothetical protein